MFQRCKIFSVKCKIYRDSGLSVCQSICVLRSKVVRVLEL